MVIGVKLLGQNDDYFKSKTGNLYKIYRSLEEVKTLNPDSVFCLDLGSWGYKDFPMEIFKFKNLVFLSLAPYTWLDVPERLNKWQKRQLEKMKKESFEPYTPFYKNNKIKHLPKEITTLSKLEYIDIDGAKYEYEILKELTEKLPNVTIMPNINCINQW